MNTFRPNYLIVPEQVAFSENLQPIDLKVYAIIYWFENMKDGICRASNKTLAELCNVKEGTIEASVLRLENNKFIVRIYKDEQKNRREKIETLVKFEYKNRIFSDKEEISAPVNTGCAPVNTGVTAPINIGHNNNIIINNIYTRFSQIILTCWNEQKIVRHTTFQETWNRYLGKLLKNHSEEEILNSIKTYGKIYNSTQTFFKHKWTLGEFLQRANGCEVFIYKKFEDYLKEKTSTVIKELPTLQEIKARQ